MMLCFILLHFCFTLLYGPKRRQGEPQAESWKRQSRRSGRVVEVTRKDSLKGSHPNTDCRPWSTPPPVIANLQISRNTRSTVGGSNRDFLKEPSAGNCQMVYTPPRYNFSLNCRPRSTVCIWMASLNRVVEQCSPEALEYVRQCL